MEAGPRCIYTRRPADMRLDACRQLTIFCAFSEPWGTVRPSLQTARAASEIFWRINVPVTERLRFHMFHLPLNGERRSIMVGGAHVVPSLCTARTVGACFRDVSLTSQYVTFCLPRNARSWGRSPSAQQK